MTGAGIAYFGTMFSGMFFGEVQSFLNLHPDLTLQNACFFKRVIFLYVFIFLFRRSSSFINLSLLPFFSVPQESDANSRRD